MTDASVFKALSDQNRLRIVGMLKDEEVCACRLLEEMEFTQPTLSHHMGILIRAGLVTFRKEGKWVYYSLNKDAVRGMSDYLLGLL